MDGYIKFQHEPKSLQHLCISHLNGLNLDLSNHLPNQLHEKFPYIKRFDEIQQRSLHSEIIGWLHALDDAFDVKLFLFTKVVNQIFKYVLAGIIPKLPKFIGPQNKSVLSSQNRYIQMKFAEHVLGQKHPISKRMMLKKNSFLFELLNNFLVKKNNKM